MPACTAILPLERGDHSLIAALDGFLSQTIPVTDLEIILVVPKGRARPRGLRRHAKLPLRSVPWPAGNTLAHALNAGARAARSDVLMFLHERWSPLPGLADYCLDFHARQPDRGDALVLCPTTGPGLAANPLWWWLTSQSLAGIDVPSSGIHNWRALRFDALSLKGALVRETPIPPAQSDERLMSIEWARRTPVRVFAEPVPSVVASDPPRLSDVMAQEYRAAHARCHALKASPQTFAGEPLDARFEHPDRFLLSAADQSELADTIAALERELAGRHPRFAVGGEAEQFELLGKLYLAAVSHARSAGWADARTRRPRVPGEARCRRFGLNLSRNT